LFREEIQQALRADPRNYGVAHPYIGHLHRPDTEIVVSGSDFKAVHKVDALGFRNRWPWPEQSAVVVLGDSVTFGYGVAENEAWSALLARAVPDRPLVNLALIGGGPQQYLRIYETFGASLAPKLVIVGLWPLNDFANARMFDQWVRSGVGGNYMVFRDFGPRRPVRFNIRSLTESLNQYFYWKVYPILRQSHLFNLTRVVGQSLVRTGGAPPRIMEFPDGSRIELIPGDLKRRSAQARADRRGFTLLLESLERLHDATSRRGAHTLVLLQPGKEEVYLPLVGEPVPDQTADLRAAFDRAGIEYLDLTPAFRKKAAEGARLFFETDSHPNPAGHDVIGTCIIAHVRSNRVRYGL
jgi:lysophospholipase L1-like esterase